MVTNLSSELSELQNQLYDSDQALSLLTNYFEENPTIEKIPIILNIKKDPDLTLSIETSNGHRLNNILPKDTKIRYSITGEFGAGPKVVEIPEKITSMGLLGKIALSHEFGHVLHPEIAELYKEWQQAKVKLRESYSPDILIEDKIDAFLNLQNLSMELEIQGWQYGKAVADLLQIDSVIYENIVDYYLESYFLDFLQKLAEDINFNEYFQKHRVIKILEPKSQEYMTMSIAELKIYLREQLKNNRMKNFKKEFKHIETTTKRI